MEDPKLARRLARASWVVLVVGFVLLTRFPLPRSGENAALGGLLAIFALLNLPVGLGLYETRAQSASPAYRAVALALTVRVLTAIGVIALLATR